jgi:hypothetical protein
MRTIALKANKTLSRCKTATFLFTGPVSIDQKAKKLLTFQLPQGDLSLGGDKTRAYPGDDLVSECVHRERNSSRKRGLIL